MNSPRPLYESIPYIFIATGLSALVLSSTSLAPTAAPQALLLFNAGLILYGIGAYLWVRRATHRNRYNRHFPSAHYRQDFKRLDQALESQTRGFYLNTPCYESLPFCYLLFAILCAKMALSGSAESLVALFWTTSAVMFATAGMTTWLMRWHYRGYSHIEKSYSW